MTGIASNGTQAKVEFNYSWTMTPVGDALVEPFGQRSGTASLQLYDDGWRADSAMLSESDRMAASAPNTSGMHDVRFRRVDRTFSAGPQSSAAFNVPPSPPREIRRDAETGVSAEVNRISELRKSLLKGPPSDDHWTGRLVDSIGSYVVDVTTRSADQTYWIGTATIMLESNPSRELAKTKLYLTLLPEQKVDGLLFYEYKAGKKNCDASLSFHGNLTANGLLTAVTKNSSTCERKEQIGTINLRRDAATISSK